MASKVRALAPERFHRDDVFIDGRFLPALSGRFIEIVSPSTEQVVGRAPDGSVADVDAAVEAARRAFEDPKGWRHWAPADRAAAMERLADLLQSREEELAVLLAHEIGKPLSTSAGRSGRASELLRYFAGMARTLVQEELRPVPEQRGPGSVRRSLVRREPRGVTAAIVPYNGTLPMGMFKIGPTLAVGGTVVLKPPPQAPLEAYILAEAAVEAGIPPGVLNVVPGGREAGERLVGHPGVDIVGFTGSTEAGRRIAVQCAAAFKPVVLELGGKSAAVVLEDADLDRFARALPFLAYTFSGQNCFIQSRIVVPQHMLAELTDLVVEVTAGLIVGDPLDPATRLGPLISAEHRTRVEAHVAAGRDQGAVLAHGGGRPPGLDRGWYVEPAVFTGARNDMGICREEVFGPVVTLIPVDGEEEAIAVANDNDFGLAGSVWSADEGHALDVAGRLDTGSVGINGFGFNTAAPFGGRRDSGLGTELGVEGFEAYVQYQSRHLMH
ncbi:aldehyde dehydrogenase family protein [Streptomyces sp. NPDC052042]|uniref:aldehyde dehydrogenase family protein n=1 Tax=Streptomyces sp. NPDC052042 TaxID=3365683 RepID=UPI0037D7B37A